MGDSKKDSDKHACQAFTKLPRPRVVAKGYLQKRTSDFSSFSPTAPQVTLRVILALTAMLGFKSWDWMSHVL